MTQAAASVSLTVLCYAVLPTTSMTSKIATNAAPILLPIDDFKAGPFLCDGVAEPVGYATLASMTMAGSVSSLSPSSTTSRCRVMPIR